MHMAPSVGKHVIKVNKNRRRQAQESMPNSRLNVKSFGFVEPKQFSIQPCTKGIIRISYAISFAAPVGSPVA